MKEEEEKNGEGAGCHVREAWPHFRRSRLGLVWEEGREPGPKRGKVGNDYGSEEDEEP